MQSIGIVVPTPQEVAPLVADLGAEPAPAAGIWPRWRASAGQAETIITVSGPGLVNAAAAAEALIAGDAPDMLLMGGIAGAHHPDARPGDILIPDRVCAPYNGRLSEDGTIDPCFGIRWGGEVTDAWQQHEGMVRHEALASPPDLVARAVAVAQQWIDAHDAVAVAAPDEPERRARVWTGTLASADTWTRDSRTITWMRQRFGSLGEDMESVALAQIATRHGIPFLVVRCLSNNDLIEIHTTERKRMIYPMMAERAALVLGAIVRQLNLIGNR